MCWMRYQEDGENLLTKKYISNLSYYILKYLMNIFYIEKYSENVAYCFWIEYMVWISSHS